MYDLSSKLKIKIGIWTNRYFNESPVQLETSEHKKVKKKLWWNHNNMAF